MITILAIGPAVIVPAVVVAAVIAGIFKLLGKGKATPPDPGSIAAAPFLHMEAGVTTAHLERKGTNWQWSLSGLSTTASSDADAGKAAVAMVTALVAAEEGAPITGSIGGPDVTTHEFGVQPEEDGWSWTITTPSKLPAIGANPAPPTMVALGDGLTIGDAVLGLLARLSKIVPWLNVSAPAGEGGGIVEPKIRPGIVISGNSLAITDLDTWVAHAAPFAREYLDDGLDADEIMDLIVADMPEGSTLNGKKIGDVRKRVAELLAMLRDDRYVAVASPDEQLAAFVVGAQLRPADWRVYEYNGYVILTRPVRRKTGGGALGIQHGPQLVQEWMVWEGGSRRLDSEAVASGTMPPGKTQTQAERYAKQQIDQAINAGGAFPGGGESGGNQSADADPNWNDPKIVSVAASLVLDSEAFMPPEKTITLEAAKWTAPEGQTHARRQDVELFDFAKGEFHKFKHWRIVIGVCMRPTATMYPFGSLSAGLAQDPSVITPICDDDNPNLPCVTPVRIVNSHAQQGAIGPRPPVDFGLFVKPLVWKGQFDGMVHAGPTIKVDAFEDVTGTGAGEQVDACPDEEAHWPTPTSPSGFYVQPVGSVEFKPWQPAPTIELVANGPKVLARVRYSGFPIFVKSSTNVQADIAVKAHQAQLNSTTKFTLEIKIWAAGTNRDQP